MAQTINQADDDDMLPEYDLAKMKKLGRGVYYKGYRAEHTVRIRKEDGSVEVYHFPLKIKALL